MRIAFVLILMIAGTGWASATSRLMKEPITLPLPGAEPFSGPLLGGLDKMRDERGDSYRPRTRHLQKEGWAKYTNRLFLESSPYLLQHAHNPVNWYPWGDEAFETARRLGRPVLLSVGYSTCHWCHVMEEESFEDVEIATFMNQHYVAIKVDREERPDIDAIYMTAVQAMTGSGGWPMTVWLTPDRKPFFGGTYFPARDGDRGASMGFLTLLGRLDTAYHQQPDKIAESSRQLAAAIKQRMSSAPAASIPQKKLLDAAFRTYSQNFDKQHGGLLGAPKFPSSLPIRFLLRYQARTGNKEALAMAVTTLKRMAAGGMYDQVGGGFHRYSTDANWLVPHFEKMLYDNALLAMAYLEGYQATKEPEFAAVARDILRYVERDMASPEGAFYSATDADSLGPKGEREEGYYFTFTPKEVEAALPKASVKLVERYFGITPGGNFEGRSILHRERPLDEIAKELQVTPEKARRMVDEARKILLATRNKRSKPLLDDKIQASWNGLMISAFARAAFVLDDPHDAEIATHAADFILTRMRKDGRLLHAYKDGRAAQAGYLQDYAFLAAGLLDLAEATGKSRRLKEAMLLDKTLAAHYEDAEKGGFYTTADDAEKLLAREKPAYDGAEPSGNSIQVMNLLRLYELTSRDSYRKRADRALQAFGRTLEQAPRALSEMLPALEFRYGDPREIVLASPGGGDTLTKKLLARLRDTYDPNRVLLVLPDGKEQAKAAKVTPLAKERRAIDGKATVYICRNGVCRLPLSDPEKLSNALAAKKPVSGM